MPIQWHSKAVFKKPAQAVRPRAGQIVLRTCSEPEHAVPISQVALFRGEGRPISVVTIINPDTMSKPLGQYSQISRVRASELIFIAGQLAADRSGNVIGAGNFDAQCTQVFANIAAALEAVQASWSNVVQFTTYLVHSQDVPNFMKFRAREFPKMFPMGAYPPNTLLMVDRLVAEPFLIEVQTVAAL